MRLPWPSRRATGHRTGGADAAVAAGEAAQSRGMLPARRSEWREVGSLRPSFVADPGIRLQRFDAALAGSQVPDPILRPLGHERRADGPAGLVSGLTRPIIARVGAGGGDARTLSLLRRHAAPRADAVDPSGETSDPGTTDELGSAASMPAVALRRPPLAMSPVSVVARSLTNAGTPVERGRPVPSSAGAMHSQPGPVSPITGAIPGTLAHIPVRGTGGPPSSPPARTILRSPAGSRVRLGPPIEPGSGTPSGSGTPATTGRDSSVMGPVKHADPTAGDQGGPAARRRPDDAPGDAPLVGGAHLGVSAVTTGRDGSEAVPSASTSTWSAPIGLVLSRVIASPGTTASHDLETGSVGAGAGQAVTVAPLVGSDPLSRTTWPPSEPSGADRPTMLDTSGRSGGVGDLDHRAVHDSLPMRTTAIGSGDGPLAPDLVPGTSPSSVSGGPSDASTMQRSAITTAGTSTSRVAARVAGEPGHGTTATRGVRSVPVGTPGLASTGGGAASWASFGGSVQRLTNPVKVPRATPSATTPSAAAPTAATSSATSPSAILVLARQTNRDVVSVGSASHAGTPGATVSRAIDVPSVGAPADRDRVLQLAEGDAGAAAPDAGSANGTAAAAGPAAGGVSAMLSDRDMDEMLRKLYPRLRRHLSSELLVARERAGALADLR